MGQGDNAIIIGLWVKGVKDIITGLWDWGDNAINIGFWDGGITPYPKTRNI